MCYTVHGLTKPTMHTPTNKQNCLFLVVFMCFLILDMLTLNKRLRTTGFEPLYLLYQQNFFSDFRGVVQTWMAIFLYWNITNTKVTTQNVINTGELYNVSFDLRKFDKKYVNKGHYVITSFNHRLKVWYVVSVYDSLTYNGVWLH